MSVDSSGGETVLHSNSTRVLAEQHFKNSPHLLMFSVIKDPFYFCETDIVFVVDTKTS